MKKGRMRLPNGFGGVSKLHGNRRNPWLARKTVGWEIVGKRAVQKYVNIGYYPTRADALRALAEYNDDPSNLKLAKTTLSEIYDRWSESKFKEISLSNVRGYEAAWKLCEPIKDMKMCDIKLDHLQKVVDESGKNTPSLKKLKALFKALFQYAVIHDIITPDQDRVRYVDISKPGNPDARNHFPFSSDEVSRLWEVHESNEYYSVILMLIYTGVRINELLNLKKEDVHIDERWFFVRESKTQAGIRSVPIAKKVLPFFKHWMEKNSCEYLISTPEAERMVYRNYYDSYWMPLMKIINMESHRPHDTRHTCISMLTAAKVDERFIQKIVGHKGQNVTQQVYTHFEIDELIAEIDKI